jgi:L-fuculose-phosphate aldolase
MPLGCNSKTPPRSARSFAAPPAVVENDVMVTGADVLEAFDRLEVLESTAEAIINCHAIGTLTPMPEAVTRELDRVFLKEPG